MFIYGRKFDEVYGDLPLDRPGHDMRYAIDTQKQGIELGWKPVYNFDTGMQQIIQRYLDNREWWEHIISGEKCMETDCKRYSKLENDVRRI